MNEPREPGQTQRQAQVASVTFMPSPIVYWRTLSGSEARRCVRHVYIRGVSAKLSSSG